jgi:hypothetical protein
MMFGGVCNCSHNNDNGVIVVVVLVVLVVVVVGGGGVVDGLPSMRSLSLGGRRSLGWLCESTEKARMDSPPASRHQETMASCRAAIPFFLPVVVEKEVVEMVEKDDVCWNCWKVGRGRRWGGSGTMRGRHLFHNDNPPHVTSPGVLPARIRPRLPPSCRTRK